MSGCVLQSQSESFTRSFHLCHNCSIISTIFKLSSSSLCLSEISLPKTLIVKPYNQLNHRSLSRVNLSASFYLGLISCICVCAVLGLAIPPENFHQSLVAAAPIMLIILANHLYFCPHATWKNNSMIISILEWKLLLRTCPRFCLLWTCSPCFVWIWSKIPALSIVMFDLEFVFFFFERASSTGLVCQCWFYHSVGFPEISFPPLTVKHPAGHSISSGW